MSKPNRATSQGRTRWLEFTVQHTQEKRAKQKNKNPSTDHKGFLVSIQLNTGMC